MNKLNKGFTLIELIVVITILAILATIAFVSFQDYKKKYDKNHPSENSYIEEDSSIQEEQIDLEETLSVLTPLEKKVFNFKKKNVKDDKSIVRDILSDSVYFDETPECKLKNLSDLFSKNYSKNNSSIYSDILRQGTATEYKIWVSEIESFKTIMNWFCDLTKENKEIDSKQITYNPRTHLCDVKEKDKIVSSYSVDPELSVLFGINLTQEELFINAVSELDRRCFLVITESVSKDIENKWISLENN